MKCSEIEPHQGNISLDLRLYLLKLHAACILKIQVLYPQEANPRGSRLYPSFLPEKFGQEFMLPNKKFEAGGGKSDGREGATMNTAVHI